MKQMLIKIISVKFYFIIALLMLWSCSGGADKEEAQTQEIPSEQEEVVSVSEPKSYYITNSENISLAEITGSRNELTINTEGGTLFGTMKSEDKRKYYDQNDEFQYAVKYKEGAFKLRDKSERLIWKVKLKNDKVKIANNEEMTNAYEINRYDDGRIKLKQLDNELAVIRYESGASRLEVQGQYFLRNFSDSYAPGVLMIPGMKDIEKFIICAELVMQGR